MQAKIIGIGNSRGVLLPEVLLEQAGITEKVNLMLERGKIVIEPAIVIIHEMVGSFRAARNL